MKKQLRMALLALAVSPLMALAQQQFSTPELAANALAEALGQNNDSALTALLGDSWQQFLPPEGIDPDAVARFQRDWKISHRIVQQADTAFSTLSKNSVNSLKMRLFTSFMACSFMLLPAPSCKPCRSWDCPLRCAGTDFRCSCEFYGWGLHG